MSDVDSIYNKPLIWQTNVDANNAPFIPYLEQMEVVPKCLTIVTLQTVNLDEGIEIVSPDNLIEVDSLADLKTSDNRYLVLHDRGQIKFSQNLEGEMIHIRFKGDEAIYMSADRIWTKLDSNGNVLETMQDVVITVRDGLELFKNATDLVAIDTDIKLDIENAKNIENQVNNSIVLATQANNTLKDTTDKAKIEDTTLNASIDLAKETDKTLNDTNTTANNTNSVLGTTIVTGNQLNTDLTALDTKALETKGLLDTSKTNADASKSALDTSKNNADASKTALDSSIGTGNTLKTNLDNDITAGNTLKSTLETDISNGNTLKTGLETTIGNANTAKTGLDGSISIGNTLKSGLQTTITDANTAKDNLNSAIASTDIAGMKTDISNLQTNKQDKTDNTLITISKAVVGAINENATNINTLITNNRNNQSTINGLGWKKLDGGVIMQWGQVDTSSWTYSSNSNAYVYSLTFPIAFINKPTVAAIAEYALGLAGVGVSSVTKTGCYLLSSSNLVTIHWKAIGM